MTARRVRLVALVLALFVAIVVFAPQLPPVRGWLLEQAQAALQRQGYALAYARSAGNPWSGVRLVDVDVTGPGVDVSVERLRVGWFLPSLLASELPLSIAIEGLRGDVDIAEFPAAGGGAGGLPITPVLEEVVVEDVALTVNDAPFTIPDLTLANTRLEQVDGRFDFEAEVRTSHGSLRAAGEIGLTPFTLAADVERADITLARHWWNGASGGTARGTVRVDGDGVRADLEVRDGALDWLGLDGRDISGPVRYRHPVVTGELTGTVLGGAVTADATVDIGARRWQGTLNGAAGLPEAAEWITRSMAFDPSILDLTGDASYTLGAVGWTTVTLEGDAAGAGTVRGLTLDDLATDIRYTSAEGIAVDATATLAGGDISANVASTGGGIRVRAGGSGVDLGPARVSTTDLDLTFTPDGPRGDGSLALTAEAFERDASITVDLAADAEGLQFFAEGSAGGAAFTGATVLDGNALQGGARIVGLAPAAVAGTPVVAATWSGPLDALAVEIDVQGDQPVRPEVAGIAVDVDLRGRAAGTVTNLRAFDLTGTFGALDVSAVGDAASGTVTASLAEVPVTGRVQTRASLPTVSLAYGSAGIELEGRLEHDVATAVGVTLEPAAWTIDGSLGPDTVIAANAVDARATVVWRPPALSVSLDGLRAAVADRSATLEGDLSVVPSEGLGTVRGDLTATLPEGTVTVAADRALEVDARLPAGFRAGPVALAEPLDLTGAFDPVAGTAAATGTVGDVVLDVRADLGAERSARIDVQSGEEQLVVTLGEGGVTAQGRLEVGPVARALGIEASGTVAADLGIQDGRYVGSAQIEAVAPVPFSAELMGAGDVVRATASATLGGQRIALVGTVVPELRWEGVAGPFEGIVIEGTTLAGTGTLPSLTLGPVAVPAQPWSLQGSLADGRAVLSVGASTVTVTWSDGIDVRADIALPVGLGAADATVLASAAWSPGESSGTVEGRVELASAAEPPGGEPLATFQGSLDGVSFSLQSPAGTLATAFGAADVVRGDVEITGRFDPATTSLQAAGTWQAGSEAADVTLAFGPDAGLRAGMATDGVTLAWTPRTLTVGGVDGDLAPFLEPGVLARAGLDTLEISGRLEREAGTWSGTLDVDTGIPGSAVTVTGVGERLLADARLAVAGGAVQATGTVLPDVALSLSGRIGPLTAAGVLSGPYTALAVDAAIELEPVGADPVELDGTRIAVQGTVSPLDLHLTGPGVDARVGADGPTGSITLQGRVAGEPQTALVDLSGGLATPGARAELVGPVSGTIRVSPDGALATLAVAPEAIPGAVPLTGPILVNATGDASLAWQADLRADASVGGTSLAVSASVAGERLTYAGQGRVATDGGTLFGLTLRGEGTDATLGIDASDLQAGALGPLLPVDPDVSGTGRLEVRTRPLAITGGLGLDGTLAGMPATLSLALPEGAGLDVSARVGPFAATAQSDDLRTIAVRVAADATQGMAPSALRNASVDAEVRVRDATIEVEGAGTLAGEPLTLAATWRRSPAGDGAARPGLSASVRSALGELDLDLARPDPPGSDWTVAAGVRTDAGPTPAVASLRGTLDLDGPTAPALRVGGDLLFPGLGLTVGVDVAAQPDLLLASGEAAGLVVRASAGSGVRPGASEEPAPADAPGFRIWDVAVSGAGTLAVAGVGASVDATDILTWSPEAGFGGSARVTMDVPGLAERLGGPIELRLVGDEALTASLNAPADLAVGSVRLSRAPWSDPGIAGTLRIDIPSTTLAAWPHRPGSADADPDAAATVGESAGVSGPRSGLEDALAAPDLPGVEASIEIAGAIGSPRAEGTLRLTGPIEADGSLRYVDGAGRVDIAGTDLDALARADRAGWTVEAALDGADLGALPLASPRVSGRIQVDGDWASLERATLSGLEIETAGGSIAAEGTFADEVAIALRLDFPLQDLEAGPDLQGRITGPVVVRMPALDAWSRADVQAALELEGFGVASIAGRLAGDVGVSGVWPELTAYAHLEGTDGASGTLDLDADLAAPRLDVESTLAWAGIESDLRVDVAADAWAAAGTLAYRGLGLRLGTDNGAIALSGFDGLAGWRGGIDPTAWTLEATGPVGTPLDALVPGAPNASGTATLRGGIDPSPAAQLRVDDLTFAGLAWGDVQATFAGLDAPVQIDGTYVDARVELGGAPAEEADGASDVVAGEAAERRSGGPAWTLALRDLPVLPDATLTANAQGEGMDLRAAATLSGTYLDAPLALAVEGALGDSWEVGVDGRALGGTIAADAERMPGGAWTGSIEVDDATLAGSTLSFAGVLAGSGFVPTLIADTTVVGAVDATGRVRASRDVLEIEQRVSVPAVDRDVSVQGRLWPAIDLSVRVGTEGAVADTLRLEAGSWSEPLVAAGVASATVAGFDLRVAGGDDRPEGDALLVQVDAPLAGLRFAGPLAPNGASLAGVIDAVRTGELVLSAEGAASGTLAVSATPVRVVLDGVRYEHLSGAAIAVSGPVSIGDADLTGTIVVPELDVLTGFEGLPIGEPLPFRVTGIDGEGYALSLVTPAGTLGATYRLGGDGIDGIADLALGGGTVRADLSVSPAAGVRGEIAVTDVSVPTTVGAEPLVLNGTVRGTGGEVELALRGTVGDSSAQANGVWSLAGLVPAGWIPDGDRRRSVELRLRSFDPTTLPAVVGRVPNLVVPLSGVLTLQPNQVFGRVVAPELRVADETLPLSLDVTGTFAEVLVQGTLGRSTIQLTADAEAIEGYMRLESFPSHLGIEALVGDTDVSAEVTGVLRGTLSLGGDGVSELRLATERIRLERDGVVTIGNVAISWIDGVLTVEEAAFEGVGTYRASGVIRPSELDFSLRAEDADFGPLLGLVPTLAQLSTDARGNVSIDASGSLGDPSIDVTVADLGVEIAGGSYRIPSARVDVTGTELTVEGVVEGLTPIDGRVPFAGGGRIEFVPFRLGRVEFGLGGRANVPALGEVSDLDGTIAFGGGQPPRLDVVGSVGNPLRVSGTLAPLDLRIQGDDLAVRSPTFLLASSVLDINASLIQERGSTGTIYVVRGGIFADQARFELGIREVDPSGTRERNPALERVVFDSVQIQAPRQLQLTENFGTLEGRADLTLVGTAATPNLVGRASAVRGNVRFFGRDFTLLSAEAVFDRTRGIYPSVSLAARTTADKSRVLAGITDTVRFVVPREGGSFQIDLAISGEVEPTPQADRAFRVQVETELSSDARIEVQGESAIASGPRPLLDSELLAVVTLGRLEINPNLAAEQGVASAVAGTALDTVVDYLVVSELQRGLSEALGVDVVEIRTSNLSQVFTGDGQDPFSVSFRLGGYLTEELFASYRIGRFDDASATLGLTNEVRFTYELGPVAFDLAGSVGFEATGTGTPVPGLSAAVRYEITSLIDLETSVDLSNAGSRARFGVTLRW